MNIKDLSELHKRYSPFNGLNAILLFVGTGQAATAALIFAYSIMPIFQGKESFDIVLIIVCLVFGAIGIGLYYVVFIQVVKYIKCQSLIKNGSDATGTYSAHDYISNKREAFYRINFTFKDENNQLHEAKTRYIYTEYELLKLEQMGTFPVKYKGKNSIIAWVDEQVYNNDVLNTVDRIITVIKKIILKVNIILGFLLFVCVLAFIVLKNAGISYTNTIDTILITAIVVSILGIILSGVIFVIIRKILMLKSVVQEFKNSGSKKSFL